MASFLDENFKTVRNFLNRRVRADETNGKGKKVAQVQSVSKNYTPYALVVIAILLFVLAVWYGMKKWRGRSYPAPGYTPFDAQRM